MIYDGLARVFTACRDCKELMQVISIGDTVHPTCEPQPTRVESLTAGWVSAIRAGELQDAKLTEDEIARLDAKPPSLRAAAIRYAELCWPVFPLRSVGCNCDGGSACDPLCKCPKKPATRNGLHDATTNIGRVTKWWDRKPQSNIGLATGFSFDVFDIDVPDGISSFTDLLAQKRIPDVHGVVTTASGGTHLYLKTKGIGNKAGFRPGLDYRGRGGYCVAPPSRLDESMRYAWSWAVTPSPVIKGF